MTQNLDESFLRPTPQPAQRLWLDHTSPTSSPAKNPNKVKRDDEVVGCVSRSTGVNKTELQGTGGCDGVHDVAVWGRGHVLVDSQS